MRSTYLIRDEKCTLDMICIDSRVFDVLAQAVRVPCNQGRPGFPDIFMPLRWDLMA